MNDAKTLFSLILLICVLSPSDALLAQEKMKGNEDSNHIRLSDSITQHGITWKFSTAVPVGRFVNGDYYVVGPATITSITPKPENGRNGSVLNLPVDPEKSGFDSRVLEKRYDPRLRANIPIVMKPGDSLISTISVEKVGEMRSPMNPHERTMSPVRTASVLTCVKESLPKDAFRPSYIGRNQKIYRANNLKRYLLPKLKGVKAGLQYKPDQAITPGDFAEMFQRPWLDVCFFGFDAPVEYMPNYSRESARAVGIASLLLMLDFKDKEKEALLINYVQYGIDLWGIVEAGYRGWPAHGGHGNGRKWPIVFAGIMLGDEDMQSPNNKYPAVQFGEDMQTMYGDGWTGAKVLFAGHAGQNGEKRGYGWGPYEHLPPSKWPNDVGENYRRCCTSSSWVGQALAAHILHAERIWNHDAFFDYVDRWMTENDTEHVREIMRTRGWDFSRPWLVQRQAWDPFVTQMYFKYRHNIPKMEQGKVN
jgi:hypothetical protein